MKELNKFLSESITLLEEQQCNIGLDKERLNLLDQLNKVVKNLSLSGVSKSFYCLDAGIKGSEHLCKKQCDSCNRFQQ